MTFLKGWVYTCIIQKIWKKTNNYPITTFESSTLKKGLRFLAKYMRDDQGI